MKTWDGRKLCFALYLIAGKRSRADHNNDERKE